MSRCFRYWLACIFLLSAGCASTPAAVPAAPPAAPADAAERSAIFARYSFFELYAAFELLEHIASSPKQAEGESSLGCRLDAKKVQAWLPALQAMVDEAAAKERLSYQESQLKYQRSRAFDHCAPKCTCAALTKVLNPVALKSFKSQEARVAHRENLRMLAAKTARLRAAELRACAERQSWFCASELRDYFEDDSARPHP